MSESDEDRFLAAAIAEGGMPVSAGYGVPAGGGPGLAGDRMKLWAKDAARSQGTRERRTRLVRTDRFVVAVEVDAVIPVDDPAEACYGPDVVEFLREVEAKANAGDVAWLTRHGKVYAAIEAA